MNVMKITKFSKIRDHPTNIDENNTNKKIYFDYMGQDCFMKIELFPDYFAIIIECNIENKVYKSNKMDIKSFKISEKLTTNAFYDLVATSCIMEISNQNFSIVKFAFNYKNDNRKFEIESNFTLSKSKSHAFFENKILKILRKDCRDDEYQIQIEKIKENDIKNSADYNISKKKSDEENEIFEDFNKVPIIENKMIVKNSGFKNMSIKNTDLEKIDQLKINTIHTKKNSSLSKLIKTEEKSFKASKTVKFEESQSTLFDKDNKFRQSSINESRSRDDEIKRFKNVLLKSISPKQNFNPLSLRNSLTNNLLNNFCGNNNASECKKSIEDLKFKLLDTINEFGTMKSDIQNLYQSIIDIRLEFNSSLDSKIKENQLKLKKEISELTQKKIDELTVNKETINEKIQNVYYDVSEKLLKFESNYKDISERKSNTVNFFKNNEGIQFQKTIMILEKQEISDNIENTKGNGNSNLINKSEESNLNKIEEIDENIVEENENLNRITVTKDILRYSIKVEKFKSEKLSKISVIAIVSDDLLIFTNKFNDLYICSIKEKILKKLLINFKNIASSILRDNKEIYIGFSNGDIWLTNVDSIMNAFDKNLEIKISSKLSDTNKEITILSKKTNYLFAGTSVGELLSYYEDDSKYKLIYKVKLFDSKINHLLMNEFTLTLVSNNEIKTFLYLTQETKTSFANLHVGNIIDCLFFDHNNSLITSGEDGLIKSWNKKVEFEYNIYSKTHSKFNVFFIDKINLGAFDGNNGILYVFRNNSERIFILEKSFRFESNLLLYKILCLKYFEIALISFDGVIRKISIS